MRQTDDEIDLDKEKPISESTGLRIGLAVVLIGAVGSWCWWASSVNTKLDSILDSNRELFKADRAQEIAVIELRKEHQSDIGKLKERVDKLEFLGSPKAMDLERRLNELEKATKTQKP